MTKEIAKEPRARLTVPARIMALPAVIGLALGMAGPASAGGPAHGIGGTAQAVDNGALACSTVFNSNPMRCDADVHIVGRIGLASRCVSVVADADSGEKRLRWLGCAPNAPRQRFHIEHIANGEVRFRFGTGECIFEKDWQANGTVTGNFVVEDCGHASTFKMQNVTSTPTFELWTTYHPLQGMPKASQAIRALTTAAPVVQLSLTGAAALKMVVL